ncbi:abnormal spindle-like microcephaly-associated protein isoform X6 [Elephas maximus indicus]|uniref:abnormal spindle-like microcephaly-associated protein isoform X6 n=1 Tax=Elephas maximus indicus TaxID=99487 RepID=UPI0021168751|nr:abnormal spindle-like microcephaly-associated protein isoform X6 [Elephas maximus indicus]
MADRRVGPSYWELSPTKRRTPAVLRRAGGEKEAASPPVLSLSHFCKSPFLSFGEVRLGASRTLSLALDNPNQEVAEVKISRFPAADQGFSIAQRSFVLQPKEKIVISVNWTPLKEGRVREIVTFVVNDILKHQAILLGNAEEWKEKKRSLWDTINKKTVSNSSSRKKRISNSQNVNKTFNVSQRVDTIRSPLQACENLAVTEVCSPTENNCLILEENRISISPISPSFRECYGATCLSSSVRRSTTSSSLHASENVQLLKVEGSTILKDFNEQVLTETSFHSINNIDDQIEENNRLILTPNCSSTLNITQSKGNFLSPDSSVHNSHVANNEVELVTGLSSGKFMKDNSKPTHLESKIVHEIYQTILSPDSFVNDNYGLNQDLESETIKPILSPNQFVKDNMAFMCTSQQTYNLSPSSNENSQGPQPPQDWRKNKALPRTHGCQESKSPKAIFEQPKAIEMKPNDYSFTKQNHPKFSAFQDISSYSQNKQSKRRPMLSTTVTKRKSSCAREKQTETNKSKAKRCLNTAVGELEKVIVDNQKEKESFHSYLPIIDPIVSKFNSHKNEITPRSSKTALAACKRKSAGNMENANVRGTVVEATEVQEIKRIHYSPVESKSTVKKTKKFTAPISKHTSSREKLNLKKAESLVHRTSSSRTSKRTKSVVPVAQSSLTFIKPLKTDIPRHPMPFAAKNMFYDERWKEKQEQGFTWWLNFILTPDDFTVKTSITEVNAASILLGMESQHKISVPRAPTKDEMSLRAYTARCRLNRVRRKACRLFTSEKLVKAIKKLEIEIEARRLIVRKDRHLWKDVGERQKVLNWLLSYNPLWLRIGLETVFGELISLEDSSDVTGLAIFILNRLLWNPDIAAEYRHPTVPHLYSDGHEEALSKFTLKKLLLLVCFLDYAKISRLIDHDPCLFCKDAEFKASKEILLAFSRDFLSGEGDLSRHLSFLGLPVSHVQTRFDEFDFAVTNLAVDLQCGVRLVRTMELLTQNWNLSKKLRIPAISRLQKIHNVDIVFEILKSRGIQLIDEQGSTILSKDIVDRHREKTLALLWKIAFAFQVDISLNLDQLKEEIDFLKHTQSIKKAMSALSCHSDTVITKKKDKRNSCSFEQYSESIKLLMDWVNAVCAFYNKKVENFTVPFSDGRVLCYLIHHYHPCYVPFEAICQRTTQTVECTQTGSVVLNSSSESDASFLDMSPEAFDHENTSELYKELLENEKKNFQLISSAVRDLGGIPAMIHHSDMSNTIPDEKVVITYLSFLCARLLYLCKETRAARLIQTTWRKYKLKTDLKCYQERDKAARVIQSAVINFLTKRRLKKEMNAALVIQKYWRRFLAQRKLLMLKKEKLEKIQNKSASIIQSMFRRWKRRKMQAVWRKYKAMKAACKIQAWYRGCRARKEYLAVLKAVKIIQGCFHTELERTRFLNMRASTVIIQRRWRAVLSGRIVHEHSLMIKRHQAACLIQANFRGYKARQAFLRQKSAALIIQRYIRARKARKCERVKYVELKKSTVFLQSVIRGWLVRKRVLEHKSKLRLLHFTVAAYYHLSALRIQRAYKRHMAIKNAKKRMNSVICIQRWFRARLQQKRFIQKYQSITKIQHEVQGWLDQQNRAALVIQKAVRHFLLRKKQEKLNSGITKIQALWRGYSWRKKNDCKKIKAVRLSLQVVNRQIQEENKLYKRMALALHYLLTHKHLSVILEAFKHLEVVTRLSPLCCENMAQSGAITKIFVLIRSCNRSVPCMEVIRYAVQVLLNVAKYEKTTSAVYDVENCIDTLLELLQMYREKAGDKVADKGGSIFTKTCCLLAVLLKTRSRASDVRSRPKVVDRIYSLYKLTARTHKMNTERILYKQKKNSSVSIPFIPKTPVRSSTVSRLRPDWVLRRDNLEEITNPLKAVQMVMDTLGIPHQ